MQLKDHAKELLNALKSQSNRIANKKVVKFRTDLAKNFCAREGLTYRIEEMTRSRAFLLTEHKNGEVSISLRCGYSWHNYAPRIILTGYTIHHQISAQGYDLELNGDVWQYRTYNRYINLKLSNTYSYKEAVDFINKNLEIKGKEQTLTLKTRSN